MATREIPREEWVRFFDRFSTQHEGWIATVELIGAQLGDQEESTRLPFVGISADTKGRQDRIEIVVGDAPDAHVTRIINAPRRVRLEEPEEPAREAIEIESDDGATTIVQFQRVPPEHGERQLPGRP